MALHYTHTLLNSLLLLSRFPPSSSSPVLPTMPTKLNLENYEPFLRGEWFLKAPLNCQWKNQSWQHCLYPAVVLLLKEFQMEPFFILVPCMSTENFEIETFPAWKCSHKIEYNYLFPIPFQDFFFSKKKIKSLHLSNVVSR